MEFQETASGVGMLDAKAVRFENCPQDDFSKRILVMLSLHLHRMSIPDKLRLMTTLEDIVGIRQTRLKKIPDQPESSHA